MRQLTPDVRELVLAPDDAPVSYAPGQWLSLHLPITEHPPLIRAYSLATAPRVDGRLVLCFDRVDGGLGTSYLWTLQIGDTVTFAGPLGNFVLPDTHKDLVLAAQYTGVVPFRAMLERLDNEADFASSGRRVHLLYESAKLEELVYHDELAALAARVSWLDYRPCVTNDITVEHVPPVRGIAQLMDVQDAIKANAEDWRSFVPLVCGVREFTLPVRSLFMDRFGLERRAVKVENYTGPTR